MFDTCCTTIIVPLHNLVHLCGNYSSQCVETVLSFFNILIKFFELQCECGVTEAATQCKIEFIDATNDLIHNVFFVVQSTYNKLI